jgi:hypothetical protein
MGTTVSLPIAGKNISSSGRKMTRWALAIIPMLVGYFGYLMQTTAWYEFIPGDYSDARFNSVILEHQFQWIKGHIASFWSPSFFYPARDVLAFSDSHIGSGWPYVILRWLDFSRESSYLGWFVVAACLNYATCFYALSRLGCGVLAAGLGAFVYAFGLPALSQEAHAQLNNRYYVPLAALFAYRYLLDKRLTDGCWTVVWASLQFLCSVYIGIFLVYLLGVMCLASVFTVKRDRATALSSRIGAVGQSKVVAGIAAGVMLVLTALMLWKYYQVSRFYGFSTAAIAGEYMLPRPVSYLLADRSGLSNWVGLKLGAIIPSAYRHEHQMFLGLGPLALMAVGIIVALTKARLAPLARLMGISLILLVVVTLNIDHMSLYSYIYQVPGVSSVRAVTRIILVLMFPAAVLVAVAADWLLQNFRTRSFGQEGVVLWLIALLLATVVCVESVYYKPYHYSRTAWSERQSRLAELVPLALSKDSIIYLTQAPSDPWPAVSEIDAMIYAQDRGLKTLNGYSGNEPPGFLTNHPCLSVQSRLNIFYKYRNKNTPSFEELSRQIALVNPTPCTDPVAISVDTLFPTQSAKDIKLSIQEIKQTSHQAQLKIFFKNESDLVFSSVYKPAPVRLSWRFLPTSAPDAKGSVGWDPRLDLYLSLLPHESTSREITVELPSKSGQYVLEFSLVHEGKYWLHDFGMLPPSIEITVP